MHDPARDRLMELCELALEELDAARLLVLVKEINRLLDERVERFEARAMDEKALK